MMYMDATIENCYATGAVTGTVNTGGITGGSAFFHRGANHVTNCIAFMDEIKTRQGDVNSGRVSGYFYVDHNGTITGCYAKSTMTVTCGIDTDSPVSVDTSEKTGDMTINSPAEDIYGGAVTANGLDTDDICATANAIGWSSEIWDLSGELPELKWEN